MNKRHIQSYSLLISLASFSPLCAEQQSSHEHTGILSAYNHEPPTIELSEQELRKLNNDKTIYKKLSVAEAERGIAIFSVNAKPAVIWAVIRDFKAYPSWIKGITATDIYKTDDKHIYVRFTAKNWLLGETVWYARHAYPLDGQQRNWGSWTLDYQQYSDFDDSVGFWRVEPYKNDTHKSLVSYSADLRLRGNKPKFLEKAIIKNGLKQATHWVKTQAESRANRRRN